MAADYFFSQISSYRDITITLLPGGFDQPWAAESKQGNTMEFLIPLAIVLAWIVLQAWVLPLFGVQTCMNGACRQRSAPRHSIDQKSSNPMVVTNGQEANNESSML